MFERSELIERKMLKLLRAQSLRTVSDRCNNSLVEVREYMEQYDKFSTIIKLAINTSSLLLVLGCQTSNVTTALQEQRDMLVIQGSSIDYADGYVNGCASGKVDAGDMRYTWVKEEQRFASNEVYATAWEHGYEICRSLLDQQDHNKAWNELNK